MASLNKVFLIGNLTRDPELRYTPSGSAVCEFGMAMNRVYTSNNERKEEVCFVDVNVWGRQAESCDKYLKKGDPLFVEGRLHLDQWTDKETQKQRSRLRVVAERTQFLGSPGRSSEMGNDFQQNDGGGFNRGASFSQQQQQPQQQQPGQQFPSSPPAYDAGFNQQPPAQTAPPAAPPEPPPGTFPAQAPPISAEPTQPNDPFSPKIEGSEDAIPF
jgi:single-strand DNA-binding protein